MGRLIDIDVLFDYFGNDAIDKTTRSNIEYFVSEKGTVKAIPKADYENRLKIDMVAVLEELRLSIEELDYPKDCDYACNGCLYWGDVDNVIQQKINELPSVTPIRPKGYWKTRPLITFCSECGFELKIDNTNYCPNCGAKMDEPRESEGT